MNMTFHRTVNAPVAEVFQVYSDFRNAATRVDGIERIEILTGESIGVGTRFKETRTMFGRSSTEEMEITEFVPDQKYTVVAHSCGAHFQTVFQFQPHGDNTILDVELTTRNISWFAKLMSPLGFLMAGTMKKCIESDIDQLKQYCEQAA